MGSCGEHRHPEDRLRKSFQPDDQFEELTARFCAGIAAAAGALWVEAEEHLETALRQAHEIPVRIGQPEVRRRYAWMLIDRNGPSDRDKARTLLEETIEAYEEIGMPKHVEIAEELLAQAID
jgi:hypothetical protein